MRNIQYNSYELILEALMAYGYSEEYSMQLICDVIEDQKDLDNVAYRIHSIIKDCKIQH